MSSNDQSTSNVEEAEEDLRIEMEKAERLKVADKLDALFSIYHHCRDTLEQSTPIRSYNYHIPDLRRKFINNRHKASHEGLPGYEGPIDVETGEFTNGAFYQVEEIMEGGCILRAFHFDLHGSNFKMFEKLWLDHRSMEFHHKAHFVGQLFVSDTIHVMDTREDEGKELWRVHEFLIVPRIIFENVLLMAIKYNGKEHIVCQYSPYLCIEENGDGSKWIEAGESGVRLYRGTVVIPIHDGPRHSVDVNKNEDRGKLEYLVRKNIDNNFEYHAIITTSEPADDEWEEFKTLDVCKQRTIGQALRKIQEKEELMIAVLQNVGDIAKQYYCHNHVECVKNGAKIEFEIEQGYEDTFGRVGARIKLWNNKGKRTFIVVEECIDKQKVIGREELRMDRFDFSSPLAAQVEKRELNLDEIYRKNGEKWWRKYFEKWWSTQTSQDVILMLHNGRNNKKYMEKKLNMNMKIECPIPKMSRFEIWLAKVILEQPYVVVLQGSNKSPKTSAAVRSLEMVYEVYRHNFEAPPVALMLADSHDAVKKMADFAPNGENERSFTKYYLRFITIEDWLKSDDRTDTNYDMPVLMWNHFSQIMEEFTDAMAADPKIIPNQDEIMAFKFCEKYGVKIKRFEEVSEIMKNREAKEQTFEDAFLKVYKPVVILCTIYDALHHFQKTMIKERGVEIPFWDYVKCLFIDDADLVPLHIVLILMLLYRNSQLVLMGDVEGTRKPAENMGFPESFRMLAMRTVFDVASQNPYCWKFCLEELDDRRDDDNFNDRIHDHCSESSSDFDASSSADGSVVSRNDHHENDSCDEETCADEAIDTVMDFLLTHDELTNMNHETPNCFFLITLLFKLKILEKKGNEKHAIVIGMERDEPRQCVTPVRKMSLDEKNEQLLYYYTRSKNLIRRIQEDKRSKLVRIMDESFELELKVIKDLGRKEGNLRKIQASFNVNNGTTTSTQGDHQKVHSPPPHVAQEQTNNDGASSSQRFAHTPESNHDYDQVFCREECGPSNMPPISTLLLLILNLVLILVLILIMK